jgi:acyl carrier protein
MPGRRPSDQQLHDDQLDPVLIKRLQQIVQDVLGLESVAPEETLPDLVNRSIMILNLIVAIQDDLGAAVPVEVFFDATTVRGLASFIAASRAGQETRS